MASDLREIHQVGQDTRERLVPVEGCPALAALGIRMCGISEARPGFRFVRPAWASAQVMATIAGEGQALVDGRFRACLPGEAYLCPPDRLHAYHCPPGGAWTLAWAIFAPGAGPNCGPEPALVAADADGLHDAVLGLHREIVGRADPPALAAWAALVDLLARRAADAGAADPLDRLWRQVSEQPARPWSLALLAGAAGLGSERLRRLCQRQLGIAPMAQVARLRMRHARLLLAARRLDVAAVAAAVGYANPFAFSTAFRRHAGMPPSRWGG